MIYYCIFIYWVSQIDIDYLVHEYNVSLTFSQMTIGYMSGKKNDLFMERYGFSSSMVFILLNPVFLFC